MLFKKTAFIAGLMLLRAAGALPAHAAEPSQAQVIERSQISYRAEGGFSGVEAYGVIISCVKGQVSVMTSVHDPRVSEEPVRSVARLPLERYLTLWSDLVHQGALTLTSAPALRHETYDEFSVAFTVSAGDNVHRFQAQGLSLQESARFLAVRCLIDDAAGMADVWAAHKKAVGLAENNDSQVTFDTLTASLDDLP